MSQQGMITFGSFRSEDHSYYVQEVPLFVLLGVLGGVLGAIFNELNKWLTVWRKRHVAPHPIRNVIEALFVGTVCAFIMFLMP